MDKRKGSLRVRVQILTIVLTCGAILLAITQIAFAWALVMIKANEPFSIGTDSQKFLKSIIWGEPPSECIEKKSITLYWSEDESSEAYEMDSGVILNKMYYLIVEVTLKEGEAFENPTSLDFIDMEPFENASSSVPEGDHRIKYVLIADLTGFRIVRFDANGGTKVPMKWTEVNGKIKPPKDPKRTGYKFDGWFTAATGGTLFDFSKPINKDTTLFAHWVSLAPPSTTTTTTKTTTTSTTTLPTEPATTTSESNILTTTEVPDEPTTTSEAVVPDTTYSESDESTSPPDDKKEKGGFNLTQLIFTLGGVIILAFGIIMYMIGRRKRK